MGLIENFLAKEIKSLARSVFQSNAKTGIKELFSHLKKKSTEDIKTEVVQRIGSPTLHYTVSKTQEISFKPSLIFMREYLTSSPKLSGRLIKDEESGHIFLDEELLSPAKKIEIIDEFMRDTGLQSASLNSHFEGALKNLNVQDLTSKRFKKRFAGWEENKESVIDKFLPTLFGNSLETDPKYASFLFRKWIMGTAKRAMEPGVVFDGCLVLSGSPGIGKTAMFRELLPEPFQHRTGEVLANIKNPQKFVEAIVGKTICNFDELGILDAPKSQETFKQLLSSRFIDVRLPWKREPQRFNLRAGWCATTNKDKFIVDPALSRRLWSIKLSGKNKLDFNYLNMVKEDLWKEAVFLVSKNEPYLLSSEDQSLVEKNNKQFLI